MLTVADFIKKYEGYSDEELVYIHLHQDGYSEDALEAFHIVAEKKGGLEPMIERIKQKGIVQQEIDRIKKETMEMGTDGIDVSFIKTTTASPILSAEKIAEIIDDEYSVVESNLRDKKITSRTIVTGIISGLIASAIGGTLFGLQMIYSNRIFYLFIIGLALLCYGMVKLATRQSYKNTAVLIISFLSFCLAVVVGQMLFEIVGYRP